MNLKTVAIFALLLYLAWLSDFPISANDRSSPPAAQSQPSAELTATEEAQHELAVNRIEAAEAKVIIYFLVFSTIGVLLFALIVRSLLTSQRAPAFQDSKTDLAKARRHAEEKGD